MGLEPTLVQGWLHLCTSCECTVASHSCTRHLLTRPHNRLAWPHKESTRTTKQPPYATVGEHPCHHVRSSRATLPPCEVTMGVLAAMWGGHEHPRRLARHAALCSSEEARLWGGNLVRSGIWEREKSNGKELISLKGK